MGRVTVHPDSYCILLMEFLTTSQWEYSILTVAVSYGAGVPLPRKSLTLELKKVQFMFSSRRIPKETTGHVLSWHYPHLLGARCLFIGGCPTSLQMVQRRLHENCYKATFRMWSHGTPWGSPPPSLEADAWFRVRGACGVGVSIAGNYLFKMLALGTQPTKIMTGVVEAS